MSFGTPERRGRHLASRRCDLAGGEECGPADFTNSEQQPERQPSRLSALVLPTILRECTRAADGGSKPRMPGDDPERSTPARLSTRSCVQDHPAVPDMASCAVLTSIWLHRSPSRCRCNSPTSRFRTFAEGSSSRPVVACQRSRTSCHALSPATVPARGRGLRSAGTTIRRPSIVDDAVCSRGRSGDTMSEPGNENVGLRKVDLVHLVASEFRRQISPVPGGNARHAGVSG